MDYDDAYANAAHIPSADAYPGRWAADASAFRDALGDRARLNLSYGPTDRQALDLFLPDGPVEGLCVFIHGGYWLRFDRSYWSHFAAGLLAHGQAVAMPSYDLCPDVRIADITRQAAAAVTTAAGEVAGPLRLLGHSAGGHLVARLTQEGVLPAEIHARLHRVVPISPVSDLRPLRNTAMNDAFRLTEADAIAESPSLMPKPTVPVTVWVGADERPVFLDQAKWLADAWQADHVVADAKHHFDVIEPLADPESDLIAAILH